MAMSNDITMYDRVVAQKKLTVPTQPFVAPSLSVDEQNALGYAGGFVLVSIKRKSKMTLSFNGSINT